MIVEEVVGKWAVDNETDLVRRYSDAGLMIRKKGTQEVYSEAVDLATSGFEYEETDEKVPEEPEPQSE